MAALPLLPLVFFYRRRERQQKELARCPDLVVKTFKLDGFVWKEPTKPRPRVQNLPVSAVRMFQGYWYEEER